MRGRGWRCERACRVDAGVVARGEEVLVGDACPCGFAGPTVRWQRRVDRSLAVSLSRELRRRLLGLRAAGSPLNGTVGCPPVPASLQTPRTRRR
jgi:hypothetical protein